MKLVFSMVDIFKILRDQQTKFAAEGHEHVPNDADLRYDKENAEFVFEWEAKDDD